MPLVHTGFLNYDLFPEYPEFFTTYQLANAKNHNSYSNKFRLSVVNLNQMRIATEKNKSHGLVLWAKVFKATTCEEISMFAQQNE